METPNTNSCGEKLDNFQVLTWNVWFSRENQQQRGLTLINEVISHSPSVACFQEVTMAFLKLLKENPYIRENYYFSDDGSQNTLGSYGVLMIWKKTLPVKSLQLISLPTHMGRSFLLLETSFDCKTSVIPVQFEYSIFINLFFV